MEEGSGASIHASAVDLHGAPLNLMLSRRSFIRLSLTTGLLTSLRPAHTSFAQSSGRDTRLVMLGTQGGPNFNLTRGESANVLVVDGHPYLVDCGYGTLGALIEADIPYLDIGEIFLSHLHDDHTADIAALLGHQWTQGRVEPTRIYGPYGTDDLVDAAIRYNDANTRIRKIDEARSLEPTDLFGGVAVPATRAPAEVFQDSRLTVRSIENTHYPDDAKRQIPDRALSYRLDSADRSVVFSGDTSYSDQLVMLAQEADVLVCEAMDIASMRRAFDELVANGGYADNPEGVWQHIVETHTTTEDAGRMANEAGVTLLVLTHLLPGGLQDLDSNMYVDGVREHFQGDVVIGGDQMVL